MFGIGANFRRRSRPFVVAGLVTALLAAGGCGGGKEPSGRSRPSAGPGAQPGEDELDALRKEALAYREKAEAAGAREFAATEFTTAQNALDGAQRAFDGGQDVQARSGFGGARTLFSQAIDKAEKAKLARRDAEADREAALVAKKRAEEAKAAELLPEMFRSSVDRLNAAEKAFADPARAASSRSEFQQAAEEFGQLAQDAKKAESQRNQASVEREVVAKTKKSAEDAGAKQYATERMLEADALLRDAEAFFAEARFEDAIRLFRDASRLYVDAETNTRDRIALEKAQEASAVPETPETPKERPAPKKTQPKEGEEEEPDVVGPAPVPGDADAAIRAHVNKLFAVETNYTNGMVDLDYAQGAQFEKDCVVKVGSPNKPQFTGREGVSPVANLVYSFAARGGTGKVVHKAVFEDQVEVTFDTKMGMIKSGASGICRFLTYLMIGDQGSYYATDFGVSLAVSGKQRSENTTRLAPDPEFRKPPLSWFDRLEVVPIGFKYAWSDQDKGGLLSVSYGEKAKNELATRARLTGRVGFEWKECLFYLQNVRIKGRLDRKWLIEELGKLGVKVPAGEAGEPGEPGGKKEAAGKKSGLDF